MPTLTVVFDCNLYRGFSQNAFAALLGREQGKSVRALASYYVAQEFLANLAPLSGENHAIAMASIRRLWLHTKTYDGSRSVMNLVADADSLIAMSAFQRELRDMESAEGYGALVGQLAVPESTVTSVHAQFGKQLTRIYSHTTAHETQFVSDLWKRVVKTLVPNAQSWSDITKPSALRDQILQRVNTDSAGPLIAGAFAVRVANQLDIQLTEPELTRCTALIQEAFAIPVAFYANLIQRIIETGIDIGKKKRANSLWDMHICFSTGNQAVLDGTPVVLVTDDQEIHRAAAPTGIANRVLSLADYNRLLDLDWEPFRCAVDNL